MSGYDPALVDAFLEHHWCYRPVDATFMGNRDHDYRLPPVGPGVLAEELAGNRALHARIAATPEPFAVGDRLDRRMMLAELEVQAAAIAVRSRLANPAWLSGEAAFAVISLLLPQTAPVRPDALRARLAAIPAFLAEGAAAIGDSPTPAGWVQRARREALAMAVFLREDIALHDDYSPDWDNARNDAATAFESFAAAIADIPDADPACGEEFLTLIMKRQHGLGLSPAEAVEQARAAFDRMGEELVSMASAIDKDRSWQDIVAGLSKIGPASVDEAFASYQAIDMDARAAAAGLVTPAVEYGLDYRWMSPCFRRISQSLYFLFYRSPPGLEAGQGSVYWITPPGDDEAAFLAASNTATVKTIHSVHHGGVGHHTQNARARAAQSRLARIAGTDCALGLAFLGAGTLIEGWACYVEDLLMEAPGFYSPEEEILLKQYERRNAASVLVDINLHLGRWTQEQAVAFYRDEAGFAPSRVEGEVVRNSMLPGSRLMYWLGVEGIKTLRRRWKSDTPSFHDTLLSYGHMPLAWIAEEMDRAGQLNP
ncbi:DUF885 family protein [Paradevosia shaoguanensis]|uniref:DUF885 domain-containing protein n=1 Tax=Paradevosia shaoguanensis TaxID=1335043 RepID=A0AA41QS80_9HYPH|nr:DUF885 family protein [Paradevosia shaoguanensis]MCF1744909.1 DUF885 domain-containing protein [Paradevosia shaoguanensis]MCI0129392.1 DUF885 domain-containing protein [Paradevosia shaoguanensis]